MALREGHHGYRRSYSRPAATLDPQLETLRSQALALYELPFHELLFRAHTVHREHFDPARIQRSTLLSIKTGGCPEDCGYCPQAARYHTGVESQDLLPLDDVVDAARAAKAHGATRFCMGAAWRGPKARDLEPVLEMVREVKKLGLETCCTLGMLKDGQAEQLREAGLDYYNHNLDTAPEFYGDVITTRDYQDRLDTLERVRERGVQVCCGGIVGLGEIARERAGLLAQLASLDPQPESVPINDLVQVEGTPLAARAAAVDRVRAHHRRGAHPHAEERSCGFPRDAGDGRSGAGAVLLRRRQLDLLRREAAHDGQSRRRARRRALRRARLASSSAMAARRRLPRGSPHSTARACAARGAASLRRRARGRRSTAARLNFSSQRLPRPREPPRLRERAQRRSTRSAWARAPRRS
jgi:biotin synthase